MEAVLSLNSVNIGGKRLYLGPWTDGSQFKRNAIKSISTWVKLVDVPHSYWSVEGLGTIAKVIGKPLSLDKQTALLNPMKFAGVLIQLQYGTKYPKGIWVPVINEENGSIVNVKVGIEYSAVPQSCCYCQAFGHPESKCEYNPLYSKEAHRGKPNNTVPTASNGNEKGTSSEGFEVDTNTPLDVDCSDTTVIREGAVENIENAGIIDLDDNRNPGNISANIEVSKGNSILEDIPSYGILPTSGIIEGIEETASLKKPIATENDLIETTNNLEENCMPTDTEQTTVTMDNPMTDAAIGDGLTHDSTVEGDSAPKNLVVFGLSADTRPIRASSKGVSYVESAESEEGEITPTLSSSARNKKRRKNLRIKASNGPFASTPSIVTPKSNTPSKKGKITDEDGFIQVATKRSLRSQGTGAFNSSFLC